MTEDILETIGAMKKLLEREREAVLAGELSVLTEMAEGKQTLFEKLATSDPAGSIRIEQIAEMARQNGVLLKAAIEGVESVTNRLEELGRVRDTLETYDADGRRFAVKHAQSRNLEKRA